MKQLRLALPFALIPFLASGCFFSPHSREIYSQMGPDKVLRFFVPLQDGVPNGVVKSYTTHGEIFSEQNYTHGLKDGAGLFISENKTAGDRYDYTYQNGQLTGPIIHKSHDQEVSREVYSNGLPADWNTIYKNPFSAKPPGTAVSLPAELKTNAKIYCGWINYVEEAVQSDTIEFSSEGGNFKISRLFSEGFTFEPNLFETSANATPDADAFTHFHFTKGIFPDREGELNVRLFQQGKTLKVQAYGYLKKKPVPITEATLKQDDSHLVNLFGLKYDADLVDRSGFQKIELNCNHVEIQDRTDYTHDDEEE
jgi:hypothetical protein